MSHQQQNYDNELSPHVQIKLGKMLNKNSTKHSKMSRHVKNKIKSDDGNYINILKKNRYHVISDEEDNEEEINKLLDNIKLQNQSTQQHNEESTSNMDVTIIPPQVNEDVQHSENRKQCNNANHKKANKMPPINIYHQTISNIVQAIKKKLKITEFFTKRVSNTKYALHTTSLMDYKQIIQLLQELNVPYYTYTPKQEKNQTYILRGLNANEDVNYILENLKHYENNNLTFVKVSPFQTKKSISNQIKLSLYLVQISAISSPKELLNIKFINHQVIHWEKLQKRDITQCYRCQRFGHTASNCKLQYRCVKCGKSHDIGKCDLLKNENETDKLYCVQCNEYGHPASYRGCPKHVELLKKLKYNFETNKKKDQEKQVLFDHFIDKKKSFASFFNNNTPKNSPEVTTKSHLNKPNPLENQPPNFADIFTEFQKSILLVIQNEFRKFQSAIDEQSTKINILYDVVGIDTNVSV